MLKLLRVLILSTFLFVSIGHAAFAEQPETKFFPIEESLSQNTVTSILQDKNGFLWIGTRSGLNKYDGINMKSYYHDKYDSSSLSNNYIQVLYESKSGELWIGTEGGGLSKYDELKDAFVRYGDDGEQGVLSGLIIHGIHEDQKGVLWVGTQNQGLIGYNFEQNEVHNFRRNADDPFSISSNFTTGIAEDRFGNIWVSTWGGGLNLLDVNTKRFIHYSQGNEDGDLGSDVIRCMLQDQNGDIYLGTGKGAYKIDYLEDGRYVFRAISKSGSRSSTVVVLSILKDDNGQLWLGTENEGIYLFDQEHHLISHFNTDPKREYSLQNNSIWSLSQSNNGIVWVGTFNKGLFKVDKNLTKFRSYTHNIHQESSPGNYSVSAFAETNSGNIWVATDGGGLDYWDRRDDSFRHFNTKNGIRIADEILALEIDRHENLWIGSWNDGVFYKAASSEVFTPFLLKHEMVDNPEKSSVLSIMEDSRGRIWFAIFREGLFRYDPSNQQFTGFVPDENDDNSISTNLVRCLTQDDRGNIWIGTEGGGLNKLIESNGKIYFEHYTNDPNEKNSIRSNTILSIQCGREDDLWVVTSLGLAHLDVTKDKWTDYGREDGFPDDVIYGVQLDDQGNLWLSSNWGLTKFNPKTQMVRNYDHSDGLQHMEFFKNATYKLRSGELLFGGVDGMNIFDPKKIVEVDEHPPAYLADFKVSNLHVVPGPDAPIKESLRTAKRIDLEHDQNDFSFEFALLDLSQSKRNEYAYQLVNYDEDWQLAGQRREAYYTNVPSGNYIFRVKGTSNDGEWSNQELSIDITVATAWYNSLLAYFVYFVLLAASIFWALRTMLNRERLQNQLQFEHMELSKMQELDEMKSGFFANISHEFRSPLTLILGPLRAMKEKGVFETTKEQVGIMIRNAESLLNLINQLLELSKLESGKMKMEVVEEDISLFLKPIAHSYSSVANKKFITYKVEFPKDQVLLYFDKEKLEKIISNLISNALKFTPDFGSINIKLENLEKEIAITVQDTGIGIPTNELDFVFNRYYRVNDRKKSKHQGTGIGLSLTKELVELHDGRIEVTSQERKGSAFTVFLKKGKEHFDTDDIVQTDRSDFYYEKQEQYVFEKSIRKQSVTEALDSFQDQVDKLPAILLIEDNPDIRAYIRNILEEEYKILETDNGDEGLEIALNVVPDLIISDVMIPGISGYELCKKVKMNDNTSHVPVVLLTAKASNESAVEGFEVGADYYITKPFDPKLLALRVRNALNIKDQIRDQILNKGAIKAEPSLVKIASKDQDFINRALAIVEENMSNSDFYVDDLGKELGLSRMQLYRKLKGLINQSANEFVRSIRLKRAAQLISQDQLTISEITYQVGFNDLQYFRDCFKKQFGVNPSEYAQHVKKVPSKAV